MKQGLSKIFGKLRELLPFFHWLKVMLVWSRYLQVPIFSACAASGLAWIAVAQVGPSSLVMGAYDGTAAQAVPIALISVIFCFVMWDMSSVIMKYGKDRFGLEPEEADFTSFWHLRLARGLLKLLFFSVPALTLLACWRAAHLEWFVWLIWFVIFTGGWLIHRKAGVWLDPWMVWLVARIPLLREMDCRGYRAAPDQKGMGHGHLRHGIMLAVCVLASIGICWMDPVDVPSVIYVYLTILGLAWICSGVGFFCWRHHVPLVLALGLWIGAGSWLFHRDYEYKVIEQPYDEVLPTAAEVLQAKLALSADRTVGVAAVGGASTRARGRWRCSHGSSN